jgi:glycosyltransferase involved in cell wall biosynthesis
MRIAFVTETYPPEINGVALTVGRTVAYLRARGHELDVIRPAQPGEPSGEAKNGEWRSAGWPIPVYPDLRFGIARSLPLARRFAQREMQLVHVATEGPLGWAAVSAARRLGLPTTSDFRTNFHQYSRYYGAGWLEPAICGYLRRFHNRTDRSFAPTLQTRRELIRAGFERVELVGRGVDLERFTPARRDAGLRRRWGAGIGPVLLHVGRLAAEKNVELALQAFRSAQRLEPSARMVVVGEGPRRRALERAYPEAQFVGLQTGDALAAHYASADIFLFPSQSETFGNVTLEALASGLPVVGFDLAAAADHITDRVNGRIVPPGNDAAYVVAVCLMTTQRRELEALRVAARRRVVAHDWDSALRVFEGQLMEAARDAERTRPAAACAA